MECRTNHKTLFYSFLRHVLKGGSVEYNTVRYAIVLFDSLHDYEHYMFSDGSGSTKLIDPIKQLRGGKKSLKAHVGKGYLNRFFSNFK